MKFLTLLFFIPAISFGQIKSDTVSILNGKVKFLAPKELSSMPDEMWKAKYQRKTRPAMVLSDENGEVNLIANMTGQPATEDQLSDFKDFQIEQLKAKRPDLNLLSSGVKTIHGKKVSFIQFLSQAVDQKIFNYYFFVVADGEILFFTFNCIEKLQKKWEATADNIVASLQIK